MDNMNGDTSSPLFEYLTQTPYNPDEWETDSDQENDKEDDENNGHDDNDTLQSAKFEPAVMDGEKKIKSGECECKCFLNPRDCGDYDANPEFCHQCNEHFLKHQSKEPCNRFMMPNAGPETALWDYCDCCLWPESDHFNKSPNLSEDTQPLLSPQPPPEPQVNEHICEDNSGDDLSCTPKQNKRMKCNNEDEACEFFIPQSQLPLSQVPIGIELCERCGLPEDEHKTSIQFQIKEYEKFSRS